MRIINSRALGGTREYKFPIRVHAGSVFTYVSIRVFAIKTYSKISNNKRRKLTVLHAIVTRKKASSGIFQKNNFFQPSDPNSNNNKIVCVCVCV